jgi:hypothetical protein
MAAESSRLRQGRSLRYLGQSTCRCVHRGAETLRDCRGIVHVFADRGVDQLRVLGSGKGSVGTDAQARHLIWGQADILTSPVDPFRRTHIFLGGRVIFL